MLLFCLLSTVVVGLSVQNFFSFWIILELNMLSFVGLLSFSEEAMSSVASLKYFIVQSLGSIMLLGACVFSLTMLSQFLSFLILGSLLLKLGSIPFHLWYISVVSTMKWDEIFILSTLQKILPLWFILQMNSSFEFLVLVLINLLSLWGVYKQASLKKIMAYSSLFGLAWLFSVWPSIVLSFMFLVVYASSLLLIVVEFSQNKWQSLSDLTSIAGGPLTCFSLMLGVLNISGVPPFFMFYAKIMILLEILSIGGITMAVILAQSSVIFIYIYMKLFLDKLTMGLLGASMKVGHVFSKWSSMVLVTLASAAMLMLLLCSGVTH